MVCGCLGAYKTSSLDFLLGIKDFFQSLNVGLSQLGTLFVARKDLLA